LAQALPRGEETATSVDPQQNHIEELGVYAMDATLRFQNWTKNWLTFEQSV
jgi:hypothetical protein